MFPDIKNHWIWQGISCPSNTDGFLRLVWFLPLCKTRKYQQLHLVEYFNIESFTNFLCDGSKTNNILICTVWLYMYIFYQMSRIMTKPYVDYSQCL